MPFVILLDTSDQQEEWVKESMQRSVYHFLSTIGKYHPLEQTALVSMGSPVKIHISFTNDYHSLRSAVYTVSGGGKLNISDVFQFTSKFVLGSIGNHQSCHFVFVFAAKPPTHSEPSKKIMDEIMRADFPFPLKVHSIVLSPSLSLSLSPNDTETNAGKKRKREEEGGGEWEEKEGEGDVDLMKALTHATKGFFRQIEIGRGEDEEKGGGGGEVQKEVTMRLKETFDQLTRSHFRPYQGILCCGHLRTRLQLHPNPTTSFIPTLTNNVEDPSLFPSMLSIIGFLPAVRVVGLPATSIHVLLPDPLSQSDSLSTPQGVPQLKRVNPFCYMLFEALNRESACAVVRLDGAGWYAVVQPHAEKKNVALILSVLPRNSLVPGIGPMACLTRGKEPNLLLQMHQKLEDSSSDLIQEQHFSLSKENLEVELKKLYEYASDPDKFDILIDKCEHFRRLAFLHLCPQLMLSVANVVKHAVKQYDNQGEDGEQCAEFLMEVIKKLQEQNLDVPLSID